MDGAYRRTTCACHTSPSYANRLLIPMTGRSVDRDFASWLIPSLAAVIGSLNDLPEPIAALRCIDSIGIDRRSLHVVDRPTAEERPFDFPFLSFAIGMKNEGTLAVPTNTRTRLIVMPPYLETSFLGASHSYAFYQQKGTSPLPELSSLLFLAPFFADRLAAVTFLGSALLYGGLLWSRFLCHLLCSGRGRFLRSGFSCRRLVGPFESGPLGNRRSLWPAFLGVTFLDQLLQLSS